MSTLRIGVIGLGTVGQSLVQIIVKERELIRNRAGIDLQICRIVDRSWDKKKQLLHGIPASDKAADILNDKSIDVVLELVGGLEPACSWVETALKNNKSVVTANKALLASNHGNELFALASQNQLELCFEAAVGGSVPIIQNFCRGLIAEEINAIYGILNGTSNFILSNMEDQAMDYRSALHLAQENGYAEADPSFDVDGIDAAQKLCLVAALAFDIPILLDKVKIKGIASIEAIDLKMAESLGYSIRPLAIARKMTSETLKDRIALQLGVHPAMVARKGLLTSVKGTMNALLIEGKYIQKMVSIGPGAGGFATASAVLSDLIFIAQRRGKSSGSWPALSAKRTLLTEADFPCRFYLRLSAKERLGVLAQVSRILAEHKISIATIHQNEGSEPINIIVLTHKTSEKKIDAALQKINRLESMYLAAVAVRIEEDI